MSQNVTLNQLRQLIEGEAVAIRGRAVLEPAGGPYGTLVVATKGWPYTRPSPGSFTLCHIRHKRPWLGLRTNRWFG